MLGGSIIMARLSELEVGRAAIIMQGLIKCKTRGVLSRGASTSMLLVK
jgi:hypothetical protein